MKKRQCREAALDQYNAELDAYNDWLTSGGTEQNGQYSGKSASETLDEINSEINKSIKKLEKKQNNMKLAAQILMSVGGLLISVGTALLVVTFGGSMAMIGAGGAVLITGIILQVVAGTSVQKQLDELREQANQTCESYNKLNTTKKLECNGTTVTAGTGNLQVGDTGTTYQPADIKSMIDETTGQCRKSAPVQCNALVKQAPVGCFKKGGACMAAKPPALKINSDGTVTGKINGKTATIGLDDLKDEASMIKAGFTPAQAKEFFTGKNNPFDILKSNGLDVKGDLRNIKKDDFGINLSVPASSSGSSGASKTTAPISSDYVNKPAEANQPAERDVASAAGEVTKEFKGEQIGLGNDDVFKMINRRYNLKNKQNNFLDQ